MIPVSYCGLLVREEPVDNEQLNREQTVPQGRLLANYQRLNVLVADDVPFKPFQPLFQLR